MNWIVPFIIGLIVAWAIQFLIDLFHWRLRDVDGTATVDCSEISAGYEKELKSLNLSVDNYKSNIDAKDVEISGLVASIEAKDREFSDLSASFASVEADLGVKDRELADLSASLDARNLELSGLSASLNAKEVEAEGLRGRLLGNVKSSGWFDWGEYDFFNWGEGDNVEFVGTAKAGETVDITYGRDTVGTANVDGQGNWKLPWMVPAAFLPGMLGFIRRDQDGAEVEASRGEMSAVIDEVAPIFPDVDVEMDGIDTDIDVEVEASVPEVDAPRGNWFNWPDWDFSGWGAGEDHELTGVGEPGGSVDINYDGEYQGTAEVDSNGRWSFPFKVPALFAAGGLGFLARNRDGAEVESTSGADLGLSMPSADVSVDADVETGSLDASAGFGIAGAAAAGAAAVGLGGAFVDLVNTSQTTIRLEDIEGDDLTKIWGIGPKTKLNFYRRGITTFEQFANIDPDTLSEIMAESKLMSARIPKDPHGSWTALAALAAQGDWDGFKAKTVEIKPPEPARKKKRKPSVKLDGDKLSDISGIGRGTWKALHGMGYDSYAKLANISVEEVEAAMKKSRALNAPGAPTPASAHASWTEIAGLAAAGDWNGFNARNAGLESAVATTSQQTRFDALGYDFSGWEAGQQRSFYGKEATGAVINFFYDGSQVGEAVAGEDGSWEFPFAVPEGFTPSLMTFTMS
ncbi:MAG: helix-hairpin-helix domain-containing protein [Anaerolineae bacterium]